MLKLKIIIICSFFLSAYATEEFPPHYQELPKKAVLLNDTSAWYHWGCTGAATALKSQIVSRGWDLFSVPIQYNYLIQDFPTEAVGFDDSRVFEQFQKKYPEIIALLQSADVVIVNGEGTLHGSRPGPIRLLYLAHISKKYLHKKLEIISHSVFPDDKKEIADWKLAELYAKVYKQADFVAARENYSFEILKQLGIEATLSFDCLPLSIRSYLYNHLESHPKHAIVLSGSVAWQEEGMVQIVEYLKEMEARGFEIRVLVGAKKDPAPDDQRFVQFLQKHLPSWTVITAESFEEWLEEIQNAELLVSGRFHNSIAAACLGTPFIILNSNTPKNEAMCDFLEIKKQILSYKDPNLRQQLFQQTEELLGSKGKPNIPLVERLCSYAEKNFLGL